MDFRELVWFYIGMHFCIWMNVVWSHTSINERIGTNNLYVCIVCSNEWTLNRATHLYMQIYVHSCTEQCMHLMDEGRVHYTYGFVSNGYTTPMCACTLDLRAQRSEFEFYRRSKSGSPSRGCWVCLAPTQCVLTYLFSDAAYIKKKNDRSNTRSLTKILIIFFLCHTLYSSSTVYFNTEKE